MPIHDWTRVDEGIFHALHVAWTVELARSLNDGVLPDEYYALPEQVAGETRPDVLALHQQGPDAASPPSRGAHSSEATLPQPQTEQVMMLAAPSYESLSRLITIRHASNDEVVALVELVSRSNKSTLETLGALVGKTCNALRLGVHVLLVDLNPPTPRDPRGLHAVVWESLGGVVESWNSTRPLTAVSYEALGREDDAQKLRAYVQPLSVGDSLPAMPLYLAPGHYVPTPLEDTHNRAFRSLPARWRRVLQPA